VRNEPFIFTSESVTEGHPDKIADQISDAILDAIIAEDANARVAAEVLITTGLCFVSGEITTHCYVDIPDVTRSTIRSIGYTNSAMGLDWESCAVVTSIGRQSPDIAQGVDADGKKEQGAGDQGMMFGFACTETDTLMPLPITLAHRLTRRLALERRRGTIAWLRPDGKAQVSVEYVGGKPSRIDAVVLSTQHAPNVTHAEIKEEIIEQVIKPSIDDSMLDKKTRFFINPTGRFVVGGPQGDTGLTGRKIIVDTYGGYGRHGGGAFSGKDPSKVDRSGAYMARYIAKNIVAAGLASRCEVQLSYAIGYPEPISVLVDDFGTANCDTTRLPQWVREVFPLKPAEMTQCLDLLRPIYRDTAAYGHFGREEAGFTWEKTDKAADLRKLAKL